jgi:Fic family protein
MELLPVETVWVNQAKIDRINSITKSIYRLITFSRHHLDDDVLDAYLNSIHDLKQLLGIKNAQMEAQNEDEAKTYLENLQTALEFVVGELKKDVNFENEVQLFQLLRVISPETNMRHPNKYRQTLVQIGAHICPEASKVPGLMSDLFSRLESIPNSITRAIYLHHEMVRIHPFVDGNGRVTRIAKNWMLMFDLYPPIFVNDAAQKKEYIDTLAKSFKELAKKPANWNEYTATFFEQEMDRLLTNANYLYDSINKIGIRRKET